MELFIAYLAQWSLFLLVLGGIIYTIMRTLVQIEFEGEMEPVWIARTLIVLSIAAVVFIPPMLMALLNNPC